MQRPDLIYGSTKTYTHSIGLSCCFRQWRAQSHCRFLHGYAIEVKLTFTSDGLDERGWVVDFGSLKGIKGWLEDTFDHKLLIAEDDPMKDMLSSMGMFDIADVKVLPALGMEQFARLIYEYAEGWLSANHYSPRVTLYEVEVKEHGANSAFVRRR